MIQLLPRWVAPLLVVAAQSVDAQAATIGMNFDGNGGSDSTTVYNPGLVTGIAGAVPQANWNNLDTGGGGPVTVVDSTGAPTGVSVSWNSGNTWSNDEADNSAASNGGTPTQDSLLLNNYLDGGSNGPATLTVSNIPYASYSLYIYTLHDNGKGGTLSDYTVNGNTQDVMVGGPDATDFNNSGYVQATPTTEGDYVLFSNLSGDFTLQADLTAVGNNRSPINGIEIVPNVAVPEPSSMALIVAGVMGLLLATRRRWRWA